MQETPNRWGKCNIQYTSNRSKLRNGQAQSVQRSRKSWTNLLNGVQLAELSLVEMVFIMWNQMRLSYYMLWTYLGEVATTEDGSSLEFLAIMQLHVVGVI
jgi:hypothetical protein